MASGNRILLVFFLISSIGWVACHPKNFKVDSLPAETVSILRLETSDISENLSPFSTKNDEIVIWIHNYDIQNTAIVETFRSPTLEFDDSNPIREIQKGIGNSGIHIITLVELDEYDSQASVADKLLSYYQEGNIGDKINWPEVDSLLADDDYLGRQVIKSEDIRKDKMLTVRFKGSHLFDKYDYKLILKGR